MSGELDDDLDRTMLALSTKTVRFALAGVVTAAACVLVLDISWTAKSLVCEPKSLHEDPVPRLPSLLFEAGVAEIGGVRCSEARFGDQRISIDVGVHLEFIAVAHIIEQANWRAHALSRYFLDLPRRSSPNSPAHVVIVQNHENMWRVVADACGVRRSASDRLANCNSVYDPLCDKAVILFEEDHKWIYGVAHEVGHAVLHKYDHNLPTFLEEGFCELIAMSLCVRDYPSSMAYQELKGHLGALIGSGAVQATRGSMDELGKLADAWIAGRHSYSIATLLALEHLVDMLARERGIERYVCHGEDGADPVPSRCVAGQLLLIVQLDVWISVADSVLRDAVQYGTVGQ
jgi:hypothetical protein